MLVDRFTTKEVSQITGISIRQIDYWASSCMFKPSVQVSNGPGTRRAYSFDDLVKFQIVQKLRKAGFSTQKIRKVLTQLDNISSSNRGLEYVSLVIDKGSVLAVCETPEKQKVFLDILNPGGQQMFWVVLESLRVETRQVIDYMLGQHKNADSIASIAV